MIHVIHAGNRALYANELDQMFRLRAKFFKDLLGWSALKVVDGREIDEYDDEKALYLLAIEEDGGISVSVRLRPTCDKSLLLDHFPHLLAKDADSVIQGDVWEGCRYFASSRARGPEGVRRREELRLAMVELARQRGVSRIVAITDTTFLPPLLQASWTTRLLGLPAAYDEGECIALEISCSQDAHLRMQERLGAKQEVLINIPPGVFPPNLPPHEIERLIAAQPLAAGEVMEIIELAKGLSNQDAQVLAKIITRVEDIRERDGEAAADRAIKEVSMVLTPSLSDISDRPQLRLVIQ